MKLSQALAAVTAGSEKTAAAPAAPAPSPASSAAPSGDAGERLKQALKEATAPDPAEKTAAAASPIADITKIATDLSNAEHEAMVKEAQLYGAALCDGFMARAAQYQQASGATVLPGVISKTASEDTFEKFAAENPDLVKEAADLGYRATVAAIQDLHQRAYDVGWNTQAEQIYKHGCDAFIGGFKIAMELMEGAR